MAKDEHRIARAGIYGGVGTFCASSAMSLIVAIQANPKPPDWAWNLVWPLICFAALFLFLAWWHWTRGINPRAPKSSLRPQEALSHYDRFFKKVGHVDVLTSAFMQDARDGRQKLWGRVPSVDSFYDFVSPGEKNPLVFIHPEYWTDAKIDWLKAETNPNESDAPSYVDVIIHKRAFMRALWVDWVTRRFA
jgi:hypothetical protein